VARKKLGISGNCYQCGGLFEIEIMRKHILAEHNGGEEDCYLLRVESADYSDYWLFIDVPKSKNVGALDKFLRDIWCECCGHLSQFSIAKSRKLETLRVGDVFDYEYDMGTTTAVTIMVVGETRRPKQRASVRLLARNVAPDFKCFVCKAAATVICAECMWGGDNAGSLFCDKCGGQHEHGDMLVPLANSPRSGECGYTGEFDFYGFKGDPARDKETSVDILRRHHWVLTKEPESGADVIKLIKNVVTEQAGKAEMDLVAQFPQLEEDMVALKKQLSEVMDKDDMIEMFDSCAEIVDRVIIQGKPLHTLAEIMGRKKLEELREYGKELKIEDYAKLKKKELATAIVAGMTAKNGSIQRMIEILDGDIFELFTELAESDEPMPASDEVFMFPPLMYVNLITVFEYKRSYLCLVPDEVKAVYRKVKDDKEFLRARKNIGILSKYALAAVNLYGIIEVDKFMEIFYGYGNKYECTNPKGVAGSLLAMGALRQQYFTNGGYLLEAGFDTSEIRYNEEAQKLIKAKAGKPYYVPKADEFLKYADNEYYEKTPEITELAELLKKIDKDNRQWALLIFDYRIRSAAEPDIDEIIEEFESQCVKFTAANRKKIKAVLERMCKTTRMWVHNGFTADEAEKQ
jgi:hypothetical protein